MSKTQNSTAPHCWKHGLRQRFQKILALFCYALVGFFFLAPKNVALANQGTSFVVMDARTGELLLSSAPDAPLPPSWLSKMMVLYIAFGAVESGEISMDRAITISENAATQPPPRLGLEAGQTIHFGELVSAVALRYSTDAATAIAEAISGKEQFFIDRMNKMADAMCLQNTHFQNVQGWPNYRHHMSARDAGTIARYLLFDFPDYYPLFSQQSAMANGKHIDNYLRRSLAEISVIDGITNGYSKEDGYSAVYSAKQNNVRLIISIFGSISGSDRWAQASRLLQLGFARVSDNKTVIRPKLWGCAIF